MEYTGAPTSSSLLCSIPWDIIKNYKFIGRGGKYEYGILSRLWQAI